MNTSLLKTKFHIPPWRATEVSRLRLVNQLNSGLRDGKKLTLVSAPAGYGKTTLIANWIHSLLKDNISVAWLSLDSNDNNQERFFKHFLAMFQRLDEAVLDTMQHLFSMPNPPSIPLMMDQLINELTIFVTPFLLVLEDYHYISNPIIHDGILYFLEHQPTNIHLVLVTRQDPPLPLSRLRARCQMTEIRALDLRFTTEEACHFFLHTMQLNLTEEVAHLLEQRTEGWAVGLQLAGLAFQNTSDPERFIQTFRGSHRYVLDYLAEEVIAQQGEEVRTFLSKISILDQFNADLCFTMTGQMDSQAVIERLEKGNLFIVPLDDERTWYRYHHLFRDYLSTMLIKNDQVNLNKKASAWFEQNEMLTEAVKYALASGDQNFSTDMIDRAISQNTTWSGGNIALLTSWLDAIPIEALQNRPQLSLNASRIFYLSSRYDLAEKHITKAEEILKALPPTPETEQNLALATLYRGSIACVRGEIQQAIDYTIYAQTHLAKENYLAHARANFNLGQVYEISDQLNLANEKYLLSCEEARTANVNFLAIQACCCAAKVQMQLGNLDIAERTCQTAISYVNGTPIPPLGLAYIYLGGIAIERNELTIAEKLLLDGINLSYQGGLMDNAVSGLASLARLHACQGNVEGALIAAQEARKIILAFGIPIMSSQAYAFLANLNLMVGKKDEAIQWVTVYQTNRDTNKSEYEDMTLARILIATNPSDYIPLLLNPILEKALNAGRFQTCIEIMVLMSAFHCSINETADAINWLTQSIHLAAPRGFIRIFIDDGKPMVHILHKVHASAPEFVDHLLKNSKLGNEVSFSANSQLVEPLSEQELRVLNFILEGKSNQEIATFLYISVGTAKWHVHNILQKLGVNNRPQAIARARQLGLG